ncbi:MAG: molybdopterin-dependent oxidoreductase [Eggerthella sp.]|uniref:molybdopterin-containing oxidoreductase family protein n=1 Tax=Eggerthella sp. TaxID=1929886 RepID=UPI00290B3FB2|nr:molybdopterin dinucleotide binding domain-containing protein [Eggerthella sp.]MDU5066328.1 molybdopterin-dependent oxidoreductase [Eggerthella sp.]
MANTTQRRSFGTMSRRSFMRLAGVTSAALALTSATAPAALAEEHDSGTVASSDGVQRIRTMCRGCGKMECGVWVTVENGRAIKIEGDESSFASSGNSCSKSQASLQACYHPDRLAYPMKRTNPKGDDDPGWVRISWDEALAEAGTKLNEIKEQRGGNSMFSMCGTSRIYCMASALGMQGILNTANTHQAYQICKGPRHVATGMVSARAYSWMATVDRPSVFVQWGGASELSNYDDSCRTTVDAAVKADKHIIVDPRQTNLGKEADIWNPLRPGIDGAVGLGWLNVIMENNLYDELWVKRWTNGPFLVCEDIEPSGWQQMGAGGPEEIKTRLLKESDVQEDGSPKRFMVYDQLNQRLTYFDADTGYWEGEQPRTLTGKEARQKHLAPGVTQGWVPDPTGFDPEIDPQIFGQVEVTLKDASTSVCKTVWQTFSDYVADFTPEKVEEITSVSADALREAAITYATPIDPSTGYGNGGIQYMLAIEHACNSVQNSRICDLIVGITGNFDTPGGNRGATAATFDEEFAMMGSGLPMASADLWDKVLGVEDIPLLKHHGIWADSTAIWDACNNEGAPYPLYGGVCQSGDVMNMSNALWGWEGLKKLDFLLDIDLWHTPTSQLADILLPARHWLEVDCPRRSQGSGGMEGSHCKCVEPLGESWFDVDIIIQLCKAMGIPWSADPDDPWPDSIKELDAACEPMGLTWEEWKQEFQKTGFRDCKKEYPDDWGTYRRYETGHCRSDGKPGLQTPTLKQEIWSTIIETYHPDGRYNLPTYSEPPESPVAQPERAQEYPYIMTTGRRIPVYFHSEHRQLPWCRELWPVPRVEINPKDALELGIEQGDWVWIETERGKVRQVADLYHGIRPGTINCEHQWWLPEFHGATKGFDLISINCLVNKDMRDPLCGSSYARAYNVKVYKATPENSPFGNPVPCDVDGTEMITSPDDPRLKEWLPNYEGRD